MYNVVWERLAKLLYTGRGPDEAVAAAPDRQSFEPGGGSHCHGTLDEPAPHEPSVCSTIVGSAVESARGGSLAGLYTRIVGTSAVIGHVLLDVTFLAYRGVLLLDAIIRTLVRLLWTRRKLLEWETAASTELRLKGGLIQFVAGMWVAPALAIAMAAVVMVQRPAALAAAGPFLFAWLLSPAVAFQVSQPRRITRISLSDDDRRALRRIGWCTGGAQGYFEAAVAAGADAFITGEISEPQAHLARETGVAFIACGHHATERFGAPAVGAFVARQLGIEHRFIEIENPA